MLRALHEPSSCSIQSWLQSSPTLHLRHRPRSTSSELYMKCMALTLPCSKSIANQKADDGQSRKRALDNLDSLEPPRKRSRSRSRSVSSYSSGSVSTISTRSSRSPSPPQQMSDVVQNEGRGKRRRRASSVSSSSGALHAQNAARAGAERYQRTRRRSTSPAERGRRRSRSAVSDPRQKASNSARGFEADERAIARREKALEDDLGSNIERNNRVNEDREMRDSHPQPETHTKGPTQPRERSLSPYSRRIALSRRDNI